MRVLVLASTPASGQRLAAALLRAGLRVELARLADDPADAARRGGPFDAVLAEAGRVTPALQQGLRGIARLRLGLPLVLLLGAATAEEEEAGFAAGADEVLQAPIPTEALLVRLRALQRRMLGHLSASITLGNVTLDQAGRRVLVQRRPLPVTPREYDVMEMLFLRRGSLVTKQDCLARLYGVAEGPESRILDVFICKLRRKLAAAGAAPCIRTVWGSGYLAEDPLPAARAA
ncbi:winged helix-turn-helix domain-containing protein [Falsiroseomonas tokyonensis]|uniref:Winged helix-turn-helix domain-containing protein n=1 Tax=Falsiroseomonas tokyonensis TaxID=430521 RepID=A0ABV7C095_9PROT|nr:response regulator transcription factor [Falsiroseomonas tokyonensis]MBU8540678.1 response regulator transcription factor [Falsiroseomonas tokyonensis]